MSKAYVFKAFSLFEAQHCAECGIVSIKTDNLSFVRLIEEIIGQLIDYYNNRQLQP